MGRLFNLFAKKDSLKIQRSDAGMWMVKKNYTILYIGSKEKCELYLSHLKVA